MSLPIKCLDVTMEDDEVYATLPIVMSHAGDEFRSVSFQIRSNRNGVGSADLTATLTVEVTNDKEGLDADIKNEVADGTDANLSSETALWVDISALLTESAGALAAIDGTDDLLTWVNVTYPACYAIRLKCTGTGGTSGSIEVWANTIRG